MNQDQATNGVWEYNEDLAALGHLYMEVEAVDPTFEEAGHVTYTCDREGCDTKAEEEGAQPATETVTLPQIQESWFTDENNYVDPEGDTPDIAGAITAGYTKFEQTTLLTCGQSAMYDVVLTSKLPDAEVEDGYTYTFTFIREPDADLHTFGDSPYYLVRHYEHGLLLTAVGKFCDSCQQFVAEQNFVGNGVAYNEMTGVCTDADGKPLPVYVGNFDTTELGTWDVKDQLPAYTNAIAAGETLTISGQYASTTNTTDNWYGFFVAVDTNNNGNYAEVDTDFFVRSDAWAALFGERKPLYGTVTGVPADMDWAAFRTLKATAEFEVEIALDGATDKMTVTYTLFNADGAVAYEFVHTFTGMTQDSYNLTLTLDGATVTDAGVLIARS